MMRVGLVTAPALTYQRSSPFARQRRLAAHDLKHETSRSGDEQEAVEGFNACNEAQMPGQ